MNIRDWVSLAPLTTLGVGGSAAHLAVVTSTDDVRAARDFAGERGLPLLALGSGSNLLVADAGVRALVIKTELTPGITQQGGGLISVGAGSYWDDVCAWAVAHDMAGIECLSGIPGRAGAACVQNIGAYGQQVADSIEYIDAVDLKTGMLVRLSQADCRFGYRTSIFNTTDAGRYIICGLMLRLSPHGRPTITYADIASRTTPDATLIQVRQVIIDARGSKGMLEGMHRSAGSFFKNPIVSGQTPSDIRAWPLSSDRSKLSAAALIQGVGIARGYRLAAAGISPQHALAIVTHPGATAADVITLSRNVQERVYDRYGVILEPEVQLWGFDEYPLMR